MVAVGKKGQLCCDLKYILPIDINMLYSSTLISVDYLFWTLDPAPPRLAAPLAKTSTDHRLHVSTNVTKQFAEIVFEMISVVIMNIFLFFYHVQNACYSYLSFSNTYLTKIIAFSFNAKYITSFGYHISLLIYH